MFIRLLLAILFCPALVQATSYDWRSAEEYLHGSTLIAILNVGEIHQAWTPEGILVQSATAKIERLIYYQFATNNKPPETIIVYSVAPNAVIDDGVVTATNTLSLKQGRIFAMLKMKGFNKFVREDPLGMQEIAPDGTIMWPSERLKNDPRPVDQVIEELGRIKLSGD